MQDNGVLFRHFDSAYNVLTGKPASSFEFEYGKTPLASFSAGNMERNLSNTSLLITVMCASSYSDQYGVLLGHLRYPASFKGSKAVQLQ